MRYKLWLLVPALLYLFVAWHWRHRHVDWLTGDESYYMVVAASIAEDHDVDTKNNLARIGVHTSDLIASHSVVRPHGWFSIHSIGISALVALPWRLRGDWGARLTMTLCAACAPPLIFAILQHVWRSPRGALWMTLGLTLGMPLVYACHQIYPDLAAGTLLLFAAYIALTARETDTMHGREALLAVALAFLPWLHVKFTAPAFVVFAWYVEATRRRRCALVGAALIASLGLLAAYNTRAFGQFSGPYSSGAMVLGSESAVVFAGLHFDQAQGMFLQQPLWLLGLVGLGPMWRADRRGCMWWLLLYASIVVPNALHPIWYGGCSYLGRFGSTGALLWTVPLAHGARALLADSKTWPAALACASFGFQALLARHWLAAGPVELSGVRSTSVLTWQSLYWPPLKPYLPLCEPALPFWPHVANSAALVVAGGLLLAGLFLTANSQRTVAGSAPD